MKGKNDLSWNGQTRHIKMYFKLTALGVICCLNLYLLPYSVIVITDMRLVQLIFVDELDH